MQAQKDHQCKVVTYLNQDIIQLKISNQVNFYNKKKFIYSVYIIKITQKSNLEGKNLNKKWKLG